MLLSRIDDWLDAYKRGKNIYTPFLKPDELLVLQKYVGKNAILKFNNPIKNGEKKVVGFINNEFIPFPTCLLKSSYDNRFISLRHQDVLGAIANLGIELNQIGDMVVLENAIYIACTNNIKDYLIENLKKINQVNTSFIETDEEIEITYKFKTWEVVVTNNRLDIVVAACTKKSRKIAQDLIKDELVKVNYQPLEDTTYLCNNDDVISVRGFGRFKINFLDRKTKKENYIMEVNKYQ